MRWVPSDPSASLSSNPECTHTCTHLATPTALKPHPAQLLPHLRAFAPAVPKRAPLPLLSPGRGLPGAKPGLLPGVCTARCFSSVTLTPCVDVITLLSAFPRDCRLFEGRTASLLLPPFFPDGSEQSRCSGYLLSDKEMRTMDPLCLSSVCGGCWAPRCSDSRNCRSLPGWGWWVLRTSSEFAEPMSEQFPLCTSLWNDSC